MNVQQSPNRLGGDAGLYEAGNAIAAVTSFELYRRKMRRETMLWNPFVLRITRELQRFALAYEAGLRPKMAFVTPPQFGKSMAAEDLATWLAGRDPSRRILYASYSMTRRATAHPLARMLPRVIGGPGSRHGCFRRKLPSSLTWFGVS